MHRRFILTFLAALSLSGGICLAAPGPAGPSAPPPASAKVRAVASAATQPAADGLALRRMAASQRSGLYLREHVEQTQGVGTYITLLLVLILSGLGLPLPEEVPLLLGGYLASHQTANFWILILVGLTGALSSDLLLFMATHRWRSHIFRWRWVRATIRPRHLVIARQQFHKHGLKIVIVARWLPALRSAVCLTAGLTGIPFWRFFLVDATAACITVPTSILLGYYAAAHIDRLIQGFERAEHIVLVTVLTAVVLGVLARYIWWRWTGRTSKLVKPLPPQNGQAASGEPLRGRIEPDVARQSEAR